MQQGAGLRRDPAYPLRVFSNGDGFVFHDRTGAAAERETTLGLDAFPAARRAVGALPRLEGTDARV